MNILGEETLFEITEFRGRSCYSWSYVTDDELRLVFVKNNA